MRYFKCKNETKIENSAYKEQLKALSKDEKRIIRKEKAWRRFAKVVSFVLFLAFWLAGIFFTASFGLPTGLRFIEVILDLIFLIISALLTIALTTPLWEKVESFHLPKIKKEVQSKMNAHLREYYEFNEPYVITKCFGSSNERFKNRDVCLYVVGEELYLTVDLTHGARDLGCYAFSKDEITLSKIANGNHFILKLEASYDIEFLLGYRAKSFIEKNFASKDS
ncbi:MAG: hypothetical protein J6L71_03550 [Clostridia bacterium]|nr:hypothetical protein [Clostridia bacterium]